MLFFNELNFLMHFICDSFNDLFFLCFKRFCFYDFHLVSCQNLQKLAKTGMPSFCWLEPWKREENQRFCCILHHWKAGALPQPWETQWKSKKGTQKKMYINGCKLDNFLMFFFFKWCPFGLLPKPSKTRKNWWNSIIFLAVTLKTLGN